MKCSTVKKYLNQEWEPSMEIRPDVREHLKDCPSCCAIQQEIMQAIEILELPKVVPIPEFSAAWRSRIQEEAAKSEVLSIKTQPRLFWLKPVYTMAFLAVIGLGWLGLHYSIKQPELKFPELAATEAVPGLKQSVALKKAAPTSNANYELKVIEVGSKSREVQRVIRNFRGSHEEGIVFSNKEENEEWTTFKELSFQSANALRTELERLGAKVKITEVSNK